MTTTVPGPPPGGDLPLGPEATRPKGEPWSRRWFRHRYSPEDRRRILAQLFPSARGATFRFAFMMSLSVVIAVMGLTANSAAAVIASMLVAPLMTPVMAFALSVAMGWGKRALRAAATVVVASVGSVLLAWLLARFQRDQPMTNEVLLRTSPDGRDFLLALAAGAAGAYATAREDVSTALPGVAVAVALVPPLGALGIVLEAGRTDLAGGVLLLYVANLVAIVLAGIVIFVATGFVPVPKLARATPQYLVTMSVSLVAVVAVGVPLTLRSIDAASEARDREGVTRAVSSWLEAEGADAEIERVSVHDGTVVVDLEGTGSPPMTAGLVSSVRRLLGPTTEVEVRWRTRTTVAVDRDVAVDPDETRASIAAEVRPAVEAWLDEAGLAERLEIASIEVLADDGSEIEVTVVGPEVPPPVRPLSVAVSERLGRSVSLQLGWVERIVFDPSTDPDLGIQQLRIDARAAADEFAEARGLRVLSMDVDGARFVVDLTGPTAPGDAVALREAIEEIAGPDARLEVRFVPRVEVPVTTTTTTTVPPPPAGP